MTLLERIEKHLKDHHIPRPALAGARLAIRDSCSTCEWADGRAVEQSNGWRPISRLSKARTAEMPSRMGSALAKLLEATRNFLPKSYAVRLVRKDQLLDLRIDEITEKKFTFISDPDELPIEFYQQ